MRNQALETLLHITSQMCDWRTLLSELKMGLSIRPLDIPVYLLKKKNDQFTSTLQFTLHGTVIQNKIKGTSLILCLALNLSETFCLSVL